MKKLLFSLLLIPTISFATGKVILTPSYFTYSEKIGASLGLAMYEPIIAGVAYDMYVGVGVTPRTALPEVVWGISRHDLVKEFGPLAVSLGVSVKYSHQDVFGFEDESNAHLKLTYKLW